MLLLRRDRREDLRAEHGRPAARRRRQAAFDRVTVDAQLSTNDSVVPARRRRERRERRARSDDEATLRQALDALLRASRSRSSRDGEGADRIGRVTVTAAHAERSSRRPPARSPTRRWSRPRSTAATPTGAGSCRPPAWRSPTGRPEAIDIEIEGVSGLRRRHQERLRPGRARSRRSAATRSSTSSSIPGDGHEADRLLQRPRPRLRDPQRGVHDMRSRRCTRRLHTARGAPVHPGVPRQDDRHQVRRRGDDRPRRCARSFARDVVLLKYVGLNPVIVHGGGTGDHRAHGAGSAWRSSSSTACA